MALEDGVIRFETMSKSFGSGSLALLRFTRGAAGAVVLVVLSLAAWIVLPTLAAIRRLSRADL